MLLGGHFDLDKKEEKIQQLEAIMASETFWSDYDSAQKLIQEVNSLKTKIIEFSKLDARLQEAKAFLELLQEEYDEELITQLIDILTELRNNLNQYELQQLLNEDHDACNAIIELHPGAGGTESQDWGEMLMRMYLRWAEKQGFKTEIVSYLSGDEAGIKSVTIAVRGQNAYGYLKSEKGVHRLVRVSPFDSSGRRHTSFASCNVLPELDDNITVEVRLEDIKVDTFRASGAGGQHINTTDSAIRITHIPTQTVVSCQTERSQIKNKERALKVLKAKLYQQKREEQAEQMADIQGEKKEIGWGNQIRSYVFMPYQLVKDHRTNVEMGNVERVMDGDLDIFINAYLRLKLKS